MKTKAALILSAAFAASAISHAAIECRVVCAQGSACIEGAEGAQKTRQGALKIANCDSDYRRPTSLASVWFIKNSLPIIKDLPIGASLASVVTGGDANCSGMKCATDVKSTQVAGASPMGQAAPSDVSQAVVDAGLPFDQVVVPAQGLSFKVEGAEGGGSFSLVDEDGRRLGPYAAPGGNVLVPAQVFKPGNAYTYEWASAGRSLKGGFSVARVKTVQRAVDRADALAASNPVPENKRFALASAYLATGLVWNGRKLLVEIERGD